MMGAKSPKLMDELKKYGITSATEIYHNLSFDELFEHETNPNLEGFEKGFKTNLGAVAVDTGIFTGRSPKDKYIVKDIETADKVWWASKEKKSSDNKPISKEVWNDLLGTCQTQLNGKKLYVTDAYCGANENTRIKIRVITELAWMSHFVKNMFIRPSDDELANFEPDFVMLNACKTINSKWEEHKLNSDVFVAFNITEKMAVVGGTWYGGEIKKGFFSIMNYYLPLAGMASMHCSANMGKNGDTAIFFGLSGTGKTTLSADPERYLIGDDEHGWDNDGIFNFEGGCYAKCISLSQEKEPDIYAAIRKNALLENVVFDEKTGEIDFNSAEKTENTRVSYPIDHISNIVKPVSKGGHPKKIIFLTADAFGVFPPVSKLNNDQALYYFLSGYTAKLAGTERGVKEPMPTFSSCFGAAFLLLHPTAYATELAKKMKEHGATAYLVNTGWIGGAYGVGHRIDLPSTRNIISAILDGTLDNAEYEELPIFGLQIPKHINGVDDSILNPRNSWKYPSAYDQQAQTLAEKFIANFENFTDTEEGQRLVAAGPQNKYMKQFYSYYESKIKNLAVENKAEIARLKDQIYILQTAFDNYVTFNSISTSFRNKLLVRHLPVNIFIETENQAENQEIHDSIVDIIDYIGFSFYTPKKQAHKFNQSVAFSKEKLTQDDIFKIVTLLEEGFDGTHKDSQFLERIEIFREKAKNIKNLTIQVGSLLLARNETENGEVVRTFKKLSVSAMIHLDKHSELLMNPKKMLKEIAYF